MGGCGFDCQKMKKHAVNWWQGGCPCRLSVCVFVWTDVLEFPYGKPELSQGGKIPIRRISLIYPVSFFRSPGKYRLNSALKFDTGFSVPLRHYTCLCEKSLRSTVLLFVRFLKRISVNWQYSAMFVIIMLLLDSRRWQKGQSNEK